MINLNLIRRQFFELLFDDLEGYLCIASATPMKENFRQHFFKWPSEKQAMVQFVAKQETQQNIWFCVNLLKKKERTKNQTIAHNLVWADLDACDPDDVSPKPQVVMESSPGRFQALWRVDENMPPDMAEDFSKRMAYAYASNGTDLTGWDLTQLLRVPFTHNFKYALNYAEAPEVMLHLAKEETTDISTLWELPEASDTSDVQYDDTIPAADELPNPDFVIYKFQGALNNTAFRDLYMTEPHEDSDWSGILWRLINLCLEVGMTPEEVFAVTLYAKCNKYKRDKRPIKYLWRDVSKANAKQQAFNLQINLNSDAYILRMPELVHDAELEQLPVTVIDDYIAWASSSTDAVPIFHELAAFMIMSSLTAQSLKLATSHTEMVPNIWGLILGDSTLSRKTTAMRMAMDIVTDIDKELLFASDGSAEGLLTGLNSRPNRTSIYYRDEVSGLFESMVKKDYMAGLAETFTQLYDVPAFYPRRLRKETITLQRPIFIFFGGGIKDKAYGALTEEHVLSGFLPRFLIVTGKADMSRVRPTGPANVINLAQREQLKQKFAEIHDKYNQSTITSIGGQPVVLDVPVAVTMTDKAWERYSIIEMLMAQTASESAEASSALPTFERLSRSLLKMAMLVAAARQEPKDGGIEVDLGDILTAAKYVQRWGPSSIDLIREVGQTQSQKKLGRILAGIVRHPGITRSQLMRFYHLTKREADDIESTLLDRQQIAISQSGRSKRYTAL